MTLNQTRIQIGLRKGRTLNQAREKTDIRRWTHDLYRGQCLSHARQCLRPVFAAHNQLGDHGVIKRRNRIALSHTGINAHITIHELHSLRQTQMQKITGRWQKTFFRIFCIDARLYGMTLQRQLILQ